MKVRIDKMLSNMGIGSRKQIKDYAKKGYVKINDEIVKNSSYIIDTEKDIVKFNEIVIEYVQYIYIMMNKPEGVVSATEDNFDQTVIDILNSEDKIFNPFPVGRLDKYTEGLLLITNDGKLTHNLLSPKKHVDKKYYVQLSNEIKKEDVEKFEKGIVIDDGYKTMPAKLEIIKNDNDEKIYQCYVTIKEGKFHQVKRMFRAVNNNVTYLKRISMGDLVLDENLETGEYRYLNEEELKYLKDNQYLEI